MNETLAHRDIFSSWSVLARWKRAKSLRSGRSLPVYFDRSNQGDTTAGVGLNTFDLEFQQRSNWGRRQDLVWGLGFRTGLEADPPPEHLLIPIYVGNGLRGETHGIEAFANVKLASRWTVSPGFTFLTMHIHPYGSSLDVTSGPLIEGASPNQQAQLRSQVNLPRHWQWTTSAYFVSRLADPKVPSYTRLDTNLVWHLSDRISLGLVGQNLLKSLHQEYASLSLTATPSLVRRSGYARLTWRF